MDENNQLIEAIWNRVCNGTRKPAAIATAVFRTWLQDQTQYLKEATVTQRIYHIVHGSNVPTCRICNCAVSWRDKLHHYSTYCSSKCANADPTFVANRKATVTSKYGVDTIGKSLDVISKRKQTLMDKYGVDNPSSLYTNRKVDMFTKRNKHATAGPHLQQMIDNHLTQSQIGTELGISQPRVSSLLNKLGMETNTPSCTSSYQQEIQQLCVDIGVGVVVNDSELISPYHLDLYVPDRNIAIEVNGVVWHGECAGRNKWYHINKTEMCARKGVQLYQVFSSDWVYRKAAVSHRLRHALGASPDVTYARLCSVVTVTSEDERQLFSQNHTQGYIRSTVCLGLRDQGGQIVAAMSFGKPRAATNFEWEMLRFATTGSVVGAMSKLFKAFVTQTNAESVVTYADRRWGEGTSYQNAGFKFSHNTTPNYWYFYRNGDTNKLFSRMTYQKHKLVNILPTFDPMLSEWDNMKNNGYDRIWDCGNACWVWHK